MIESKLITLLKTLSKRELTRLDEFVRSPFYNKNKNVIRLFEEINVCYPFEEGKDLMKETLFGKIFPGEKYNEAKLKNVVSDLYGLTGRYLVCISKDENSIERRTALAKILLDRNAEKAFRACVNDSEKELRSYRPKEKNYFYYRWNLERENGLFLSERDRNKYGNNLQKELDNFVNFALLVLMEIYIRMINEEGYMNIEYNRTFQNEVIGLFKNRDYSSEPIIEIYYNILQLRLTFEEKYFLRLRDLKKLHYGAISAGDMYIINSNLQSFYLIQLNKGISTYQKDYFELQKETLDVFNPEQTISYILFLNIVKTAAGLGEFDWAKDFISGYRSKLSVKYRDAVVSFSDAYIYYRQGDLNKSLEILSRTYTETMQINLEIKKLTMIIYYEMGSFESALSLVDYFRNFIKTEKIKPNDLKKVLSGFANYYSELVKFRINGNRERAGMLLNKLETQPYISNKQWLTNKFREFARQL